MKCISCGRDIPSGNVYCPLCGKEAQIISDKTVLEDDLLKVLMDSEEFSGEVLGSRAVYEEQRLAEEKELRRQKKLELQKKKKKQRLIILLVVIAACIVGVGVFFGIKKSTSYDSLYNKADVAYHTAKYEDAIEYAVRALEKSPDSVETYILLGDIYVQMEDYENANNCYNKALSIAPNNVTIYEKLLRMFSAQDDYASIQELYESAPLEDAAIKKAFSDYLIPLPEVNIKGGAYEEVIELSLSSKDGLVIYYTIDGTTPSKDKQLYEKPFKLDKEGEIVLKAICMDEKGNASHMLEETYVLEFAIPDIPEVTPDGGEITSKQTVSIYVEEGITVYYTWDGSTPNKSATKYEGPFEIPEGNNILSVIAIDDITDEKSEVFKTNFIYYPVADETTTNTITP